MDPQFEAVHSDADSSFRCLHFHCGSFAQDHAWHYHPEYELTWVARSEGTRFVGDSIQHYDPGDLALIGPNLPHCWHDEPAVEGADSPEVVVVQFGPDCLGRGFLELDAAREARDLLARAAQGIVFTPATARDVAPLLLAMTRQRGLERVARLLDVLAVLAAAKGARTLASPDYQLNNDINPVNRRRIELVHRYVRDQLAGDISQAHVAQRLNLSPPAFSRFFKAATGKTFVEFVNALRVNEACRLLGGSNTSITAIAMACGYRNMANFNRRFRALRGMNPSEYRRRLRLRETRAALPLPPRTRLGARTAVARPRRALPAR